MESLGAATFTARDTNTFDGSSIPIKNAIMNKEKTLNTASLMSFIGYLFPLKGFKSNRIHNNDPDAHNAQFFPALRQARAFKSDITHRIVEMR
jgi:hypothetical protein